MKSDDDRLVNELVLAITVMVVVCLLLLALFIGRKPDMPVNPSPTPSSSGQGVIKTAPPPEVRDARADIGNVSCGLSTDPGAEGFLFAYVTVTNSGSDTAEYTLQYGVYDSNGDRVNAFTLTTIDFGPLGAGEVLHYKNNWVIPVNAEPTPAHFTCKLLDVTREVV